MESGYDGLKAAEKKLRRQDQGAVHREREVTPTWSRRWSTLASKNELVIGVGGQTQASVFKVAQALPEGEVRHHRRQRRRQEARQRRAATTCGRPRSPSSPARRRPCCRRPARSATSAASRSRPIVNAGKEFGNGAKYINPNIKYFENYTGDFDDVAKSKEATLAAIAQGADIHYHILNLGLRGMEQAASEKGTHIIGSYTDRCGTDPLYVAYSITGVGFQVQYAIDQAVAGTWKPGYKPFGLAMGPQASGMVICKAHAPSRRPSSRRSRRTCSSGKIKVLKADVPASGLGRSDGACVRAAAGARRSLGKRFGSLQALDEVSPRRPRRRGPLPARRERRRQVDAVQPDLRRHEPDAGAHALRRRAVRARRPGRGAARRASPWCTSISAWCRDMTVVENLMLGQVSAAC